MKQRIPLCLAAAWLAVGPAPADAVSTQYWIDDLATDFVLGDATDVSVTSEGSLRLAPRTEVVAEPEVPYVWDVVQGPGKAVYLGTGDDGWVLRVRDGKTDNFFQCAALEVLALESSGGTLWAGTAPEGFVYQVNEAGEGTILFDAEEEYVWDLLLGPDGFLYAAVGPGAAVYRIDRESGKAEKFVEIEDNHVVCLAFDEAGRLLFGTEGRGLVGRVDKDGRVRVLHDCPQGEVGAVLAGPDGVVWAAAAATAELRERATPDKNGDGTGIDDPYTFDFTTPATGNGVLYRIDDQGNAVRFWESGQGTIFDLSFAGNGEVLAATGDEGALFSVDANGEATLLLDAQEDQVVALLRSGAEHWLATANPSRLIRMGDDLASEGTYESRVIDARRVSNWGRLDWTGDSARGKVAFDVRTGSTDEPDKTWTDWHGLDDDGRIEEDASRYLQWRARLKGGGRNTPTVRRVRVSSLQRNLPPILADVEVVPAGNRFYDEVPEVRPRPLYQALPDGVKVQYSFDMGGDEALPPERRAPWTAGMRQVRWDAIDPNEDGLLFDLAFRREDETVWKEFAEEVDGKNWTFNSRGVPDGEYRIRVTASDKPGNPTGGLEVSRVSEVFIVDNTSPDFRNLEHRRRGESVQITGRVEDAASDIVRLEYSVNGGDWKDNLPTDGIFDSRAEDMDVTVEAPGGAEHSILLRGTDLAGNLRTTRVLVRP